MARILLIDDDANFREVLAFALQGFGHEVRSFGDGPAALASLAQAQPDLVITDLKMPGLSGIEILEKVTALDPSIPVVLLTAFGSIEQAVEAMRRGAHDYLTKPYNRDELRVTIDKALERRRLVLENRNLRTQLQEQKRNVEIVHASPAMERILATVRRIAPSDATVLLTGESGTGKEVIAHALHAYSDRWDRNFVAVNCAALPKDLMESELFGYARGAFTGATKDKPGKFQRADGGTLFLDEVADLPAELQTKLLRVLDTRQVDVLGAQSPVSVDVRLVAATNADLAARVKDGTFRGDLYYRLNVIPMHIPPLRERRDDIPALWDYFLRKHAPDHPLRTTPELMEHLMDLDWPGNVRELANVCKRMVLLRVGDTLGIGDLPPEMAETTATAGVAGTGGGVESLIPALPESGVSLPELERDLIRRALAKHNGNRTRTAEYLGIPRHVLLYRLEKFGIQ